MKTSKRDDLKKKEIVRKWFPILLKEDPSFREEVMAHLTGVLATKDDIAKILARLEEHSTILREHSTILEEHLKVLQAHTKSLEKVERTLSAIGARWGILAEDAFRDGMRGILEDLGFSVKKWRVRDEKGIVFGRPAMVEADLAIRNKEHLLIEIKSSISHFDIAGFVKIGAFYQAKKGVKPRLLVISPFIDRKAWSSGETLMALQATKKNENAI